MESVGKPSVFAGRGSVANCTSANQISRGKSTDDQGFYQLGRPRCHQNEIVPRYRPTETWVLFCAASNLVAILEPRSAAEALSDRPIEKRFFVRNRHANKIHRPSGFRLRRRHYCRGVQRLGQRGPALTRRATRLHDRCGQLLTRW